MSYTKVRDFAYHDRHPLHYGVRLSSLADVASPEIDASLEAEEAAPDAKGDTLRKTKDDIYSRAVALFDFEPENNNEAALVEGQIVWISYRHGHGWLVAENLETGETGLVPEEYVQVLPGSESEWYDAN